MTSKIRLKKNRKKTAYPNYFSELFAIIATSLIPFIIFWRMDYLEKFIKSIKETIFQEITLLYSLTILILLIAFYLYRNHISMSDFDEKINYQNREKPILTALFEAALMGQAVYRTFAGLIIFSALYILISEWNFNNIKLKSFLILYGVLMIFPSLFFTITLNYLKQNLLRTRVF
ncbi:hypothetical protein [Marinomonas sp. ef1]|uniref:hypothetical protein n=1 Tax=Marinomonas sp. ef1 TaxID=2005043 RepID=UPI000C28536B|nr:hypothetical protein [Marinomonas sp. ef1]